MEHQKPANIYFCIYYGIRYTRKRVAFLAFWDTKIGHTKIGKSKVVSLLSNKSFFLWSCYFLVFDECLRCVRVIVMSKCKPSSNNSSQKSTLGTSPLCKGNYLTMNWTLVSLCYTTKPPLPNFLSLKVLQIAGRSMCNKRVRMESLLHIYKVRSATK